MRDGLYLCGPSCNLARLVRLVPSRFIETSGGLPPVVSSMIAILASNQGFGGTGVRSPILGRFPMPPAGLKRGGARNLGGRASWQLSERQCHLLIARGFAAWDAGQPMSRFLTLAWGLAGIEANEAVKATGQFISRARDWMHRHGYSMPWIWVQESGSQFGQHAHILLHVPSELDLLFRPMPLRWAKSVVRDGYVAGTLQSQRLGEAYSASVNAGLYEARLLGKLHYMLKCAPIQLERKFLVEGWGHKPWGQSSNVIGKRAAVWQMPTAEVASICR